MLTTVLNYKNEGRTLIMLTGDGNDNGGGDAPSFPKVVHEAIELGWKVEVWCWKASCSKTYKDLEVCVLGRWMGDW